MRFVLLNRTFFLTIMEVSKMKRFSRIFTTSIFILFLAVQNVFAVPYFNKNLTSQEQKTLDNGEVLIKNIVYQKYMCLNKGYSTECDNLIAEIKALNPKYLAEIIQIKPYKGNENLPQVLTQLLYNVSDYTSIPYYSERAEAWYNLYDSAVITNEKIVSSNTYKTEKEIQATFIMEPFGTVYETIILNQSNDSVYYSSVNNNKLRYLDQFDCVWPKKLKICIILFRDGDNWILYGIGGVNAPRIPFFTERIETSFINRIKSFCNFIFTKF